MQVYKKNINAECNKNASLQSLMKLAHNVFRFKCMYVLLVRVFSGTNVALFMWIFYPVVSLPTVNITVVFLVMCIRVCGKKRPGLITKGVLFLQDNARAHTAHRTTCTLQQLGWEVLLHSPYSLDLAPSDFHLSGPLKEFLGGQNFSTDDEVKQAVLGWFSRNDKFFCAEAFQALVKRWDKCINVAGEYVEK